MKFFKDTKLAVDVYTSEIKMIENRLNNAAKNSMAYKTELALVKSQNIDITNFETNLETLDRKSNV